MLIHHQCNQSQLISSSIRLQIQNQIELQINNNRKIKSVVWKLTEFQYTSTSDNSDHLKLYNPLLSYRFSNWQYFHQHWTTKRWTSSNASNFYLHWLSHQEQHQVHLASIFHLQLISSYPPTPENQFPLA